MRGLEMHVQVLVSGTACVKTREPWLGHLPLPSHCSAGPYPALTGSGAPRPVKPHRKQCGLSHGAT